jgi:hypothetical protein
MNTVANPFCRTAVGSMQCHELSDRAAAIIHATSSQITNNARMVSASSAVMKWIGQSPVWLREIAHRDFNQPINNISSLLCLKMNRKQRKQVRTRTEFAMEVLNCSYASVDE